jgi:hypothetical protein
MPTLVKRQTVHPRKLAAVRREVAPGAVGSALGPAVGKVWDFIRGQPGLWTEGHNIFLYHHTERPGAPGFPLGLQTRPFPRVPGASPFSRPRNSAVPANLFLSEKDPHPPGWRPHSLRPLELIDQP